MISKTSEAQINDNVRIKKKLDDIPKVVRSDEDCNVFCIFFILKRIKFNKFYFNASIAGNFSKICKTSNFFAHCFKYRIFN